MDKQLAVSAAKCPDCGRHPSACWTMPCLGLEIAMSQGIAAMRRWSKDAGIVINNEAALEDEIRERRERIG